MGKTSIEWTRGDDGSMGETWNPVRGCSRVSPGCENCYAERVAARFSGPGQPYDGLAIQKLQTLGEDDESSRVVPRWTGKVRLVPEHLADPLKWRRPRRVFVNSMSDLFHEKLTNEEIAAVFGVMAAAPRHTFQVLTKRPERMREWFEWVNGLHSNSAGARDRCSVHPVDICASMTSAHGVDRVTARTLYEQRGGGPAPWPLANVHLGVSVEDQKRADERIPLLLETPAAVRFLSVEPLLGPVSVVPWLRGWRCSSCHEGTSYSILEQGEGESCESCGEAWSPEYMDGIDWVIIGAESGPGARPCDLAWVRSLVEQCRAAGVPVFVKQLQLGGKLVKDLDQFPADLRVRDFPRSNP